MTPDPRDLCSRCFRYSDLIECGDTWTRHVQQGTPLGNLPACHETYDAIAQLAQLILDPLQEHLGPVALTYGFAGPSLTRRITGRIAPDLDQHAGSEVNARGRLICSRRGQSCDLRVVDRTSLEVARYIRDALPFDRMYLYGYDRPLHVSYGPEPARKVYAMVPRGRGRVPRDVTTLGWEAITALFDPP